MLDRTDTLKLIDKSLRAILDGVNNYISREQYALLEKTLEEAKKNIVGVLVV